MKNSVFVILFLCLTACGAKHPLQRGETQDGDGSGPSVSRVNWDGRGEFNDTILPLQNRDCDGCHSSGVPAATYESALSLVEAGEPEKSSFYLKAKGEMGHMGGEIWSDGSLELEKLKTWIIKLGQKSEENHQEPDSEEETLEYDSLVEFNERLWPMIQLKECRHCHTEVSDGDLEFALAWVLESVVIGDPRASRIYLNVEGGDPDHDQINWLKSDPQALESLGLWIFRLQFHPIE